MEFALSTPRQVVVNGKFLTAEPTGVHRVAGELIRNAHALINADPALMRRLSLSLWVPASGEQRARRLGLPYEVVGPLDGILWEQITLPARAMGKTILSLCNVGPIAARDAITMFHDAQVHISPESYSKAFRLWYRFHQPIAGRRHRRILTVSRFSRDQLARYGLAEKERTGVISNGVDHVLDAASDQAIVAELGLTPARYVVGLANTQPHKNVGLLLKAFAEEPLRDLRLVLFGPASSVDFAAAGYVVPENVCFAGRISDGKLRALYEAALCLAFPSTTEGFGLPPLEAMTFACPAIVAPAGALVEVCGQAGIYADPRDVNEWVMAIRMLADDADGRDRKRRESQEWAANFTWRNAATRLIEELLAL